MAVTLLLYYSLTYPFLTCGIQARGITYPNYLSFLGLNALSSMIKSCDYFAGMSCQNNDLSDSRSHSEPLLKSLRLPKFCDIIHLEILSFVYH